VKEDVPNSPYMYGLDAAGSSTAVVSMLVEEGGRRAGRMGRMGGTTMGWRSGEGAGRKKRCE